jgi:metallo-beta-lactamase family protein
MKITFLGAAKTVTGSCYFIETNDIRFLVDCGMFQGQARIGEDNNNIFPFNPGDLDFILLTHAHIDHCGRIPKIFLDGFKNSIYATKATVELCEIMLPDSGSIQESENEWINRKRERAGKEPVKPLYTSQDAKNCQKLFVKTTYGQIIEPAKGIKVRFNDAGHILGSAILEIWINEDGKEIKVVFSGDLGNKGMPILRDPTIIDSADYLIIESTYGNKRHDGPDKIETFINAICDTADKHGNVIIPSFAVGRTQEIIYDLNKHMDPAHKNKDPLHSDFERICRMPVFVDSPLAVSATEVFRNNLDCFDQEAREYIENGDNPLDFPGLQFTRSVEESKALNFRQDSVIIISASGMCEAGRIKHHLKHNLWRKESTVIFVGYQANGTLGRRLVDGAKKVMIFGEEISVNARIVMIEGFSGHADIDGLIDWIKGFKKIPEKIFLVHGEQDSISGFSDLLWSQFGVSSIIPDMNDSYELQAEGIVNEIEAKPIYQAMEKKQMLLDRASSVRKRMLAFFDKLVSMVKAFGDQNDLDNLEIILKKIDNDIN